VPRLDVAAVLARTLGVDMNTLAGFVEPSAPELKRKKK
jgi:hypothetical protein